MNKTVSKLQSRRILLMQQALQLDQLVGHLKQLGEGICTTQEAASGEAFALEGYSWPRSDTVNFILDRGGFVSGKYNLLTANEQDDLLEDVSGFFFGS